MEASIIIPTYNRALNLQRTLEALETQETEENFEIIVVDDGSTDTTATLVNSFSSQTAIPVSYYYQPNRKQGAARNLGARFAEGRYLLFLGDDIVPGPHLLQKHLERQWEAGGAHHRAASDETENVVVIGYTVWPEEWEKTRFLEFIGEKGWQFGFSLIDDHDDVPFNFFYTSNLSLPRGLFLDSGGFDEDFDAYGWEDIELSLRLREMGSKMVFQPEARAFHYHPTDIASFARRQHQVGLSACRLLEKHPEMGDFLGIDRMPRYNLRKRLQLSIIFHACRLTEKRPWPDLSGFYPDLLSYWYIKGVLDGFSNQRDEFYRKELARGRQG